MDAASGDHPAGCLIPASKCLHSSYAFVVGDALIVDGSSTLGPPTGQTFDAMMRHFESRRDKEFALHDCAEHPRKLEPTSNAT
jgi:hypothetical protein